jgi:hypothetical protein
MGQSSPLFAVITPINQHKTIALPLLQTLRPHERYKKARANWTGLAIGGGANPPLVLNGPSQGFLLRYTLYPFSIKMRLKRHHFRRIKISADSW